MANTGIVSLILIVINVLVTYRGLKDSIFFDRYKFDVGKILISKEYNRLITSGFLHVSWTHLIFNVLSLYFFSGVIESSLGIPGFLMIYFASLLGGNMLSLYIHRNHSDYSSVGASSAVTGIIFGSIALFPDLGIGLFFLPISIPSWVYGLLFMGFSIYGIRSKKENIGHEAHLGGALVGLLTAIIIRPSSLVQNYVSILIIAVPAIVFIYIIVTRPHLLLVDNLFFKKQVDYYSPDHKYNESKHNDQQEIDRILDKINKKGIGSLSRKEKDSLKDYSQSIR